MMGIKASIRTLTVPTAKVKVASAGVTRLDQLLDVVEPPDAPENSVLVYHPDIDKYVVQELNLDGGTF